MQIYVYVPSKNLARKGLINEERNWEWYGVTTAVITQGIYIMVLIV